MPNDGKMYIRFNHETRSWQRMGTFGHFYNVTVAIARVLRDQGAFLWAEGDYHHGDYIR